MSNDANEKAPFEVRQEADRVDSSRLRRAALVGTLGMIVAVAATVALLSVTDRPSPTRERAPGPAPSGTVETSLVLSTDRGGTFNRARRSELDRFGWVDRDAGVARIPVDRAIDLIAEDAGP